MRILTELGLNEYEAKAYDALARYGKATASRISSASGVSHSRIYDILASLANKGLVKTLPGQTKEFMPTDPKKLLELLEQRKKIIAEGEKDILNLKKIYDTSYKEPVLISTGQKNFYSLLKETASPKKNYVYNIRYMAEPKPEWLRKDAEKVKTGMDMRTLVRVDTETKNNISKWKKFTKIPMKSIDNEGVAMMIHNDEEVLIGLIKSNTTILIRDKPFAKLMKKMYISTWEKSKGI